MTLEQAQKILAEWDLKYRTGTLGVNWEIVKHAAQTIIEAATIVATQAERERCLETVEWALSQGKLDGSERAAEVILASMIRKAIALPDNQDKTL